MVNFESKKTDKNMHDMLLEEFKKEKYDYFKIRSHPVIIGRFIFECTLNFRFQTELICRRDFEIFYRELLRDFALTMRCVN